jgi:hypothetical protein
MLANDWVVSVLSAKFDRIVEGTTVLQQDAGDPVSGKAPAPTAWHQDKSHVVPSNSRGKT